MSKEEIVARRRKYYLRDREKEKEYSKAYYQENKEGRKQWQSQTGQAKEYYQKNKRRLRKYSQEYYQDNIESAKQKRRVAHVKWCQANPEYAKIISKAHSVVMDALKSGKLVRPEHCSRCSKECRVHAHHSDYAKLLEVTWVCNSCHRIIHWEEKITKRT